MEWLQQTYAESPEFLPVKNEKDVGHYSHYLWLLYTKPETNHLARYHWKVAEIKMYKNQGTEVKRECLIATLNDGGDGQVLLKISHDFSSVVEVVIVEPNLPNFDMKQLTQHIVFKHGSRISLPQLIVMACAINNFSREYRLFEKGCYWFCYTIGELLLRHSIPWQGTSRESLASSLRQEVNLDVLSAKYDTMWNAFENDISLIINRRRWPWRILQQIGLQQHWQQQYASKTTPASVLEQVPLDQREECQRDAATHPSSPTLPLSFHATFQLLIATLTNLRAVRGPMVNDETLLLFCEVLDCPSPFVDTTLDPEVLFDFILYLLREGSLSNCIVRDANRKARRLMFKLVSETDIMPRSLFITNVEKDPQTIAVGGFGKVFKGKCGGELVALKMLHRGHSGDSIKKSIYTEALAWRSLSHRFILPLLGIYEEGPELFLVSPFMANGSLRHWRKHHVHVRIDEIRRLLLEVAQAIQYIHSEGIVHGDLHPDNVLLDSEFHCQITDFGSTRHSDVTVTRSTTALICNYAAPELFGICTTCYQFDCDGFHDGQDMQHRTKTMETDVYAFGCVYYAIFFDTVPFHGKSELNILLLFAKGARPDRLENPIMQDLVWDLIQKCWKSNPTERPTMEEIATVLTLVSLRRSL